MTAGPANVLPVNCLDCSLHTLCLVAGLTAQEMDRLSGMVTTRRRVRRGASLYTAGDRFEAIFPIRFGSFKARVLSAEGREQIIGFPLPGDLLGFDAVSSGRFSRATPSPWRKPRSASSRSRSSKPSAVRFPRCSTGFTVYFPGRSCATRAR